MPKTNEELGALFSEWADLLAIGGSDSFRIRAYEKAARAIASHSKDARDSDVKDLLEIPSVGKNMAERIVEYCRTGRMHELEELREQVPAGLRELMRIPGMGPKKAVLVHETLGITSIPDLLEAIEDHRLRDIKGLGPKTEENLLRGVRNLQEHGERINVDVALSIAEEILEGLRGHAAVEDVSYAGSLRRMRETIGDVDVLVASSKAAEVMDAFTALDIVKEVLAHGETKSSVLTWRGLQVDLRVVPADAWGAALQYFTGSKAHNIRVREMAVKMGLKLSEYGLFRVKGNKRIAARTEEEVYEALGLPWIPPTMREDTGEVEAALRGELPDPVVEKDIRGDLHTHTNLTDGMAPLEEMIAWAAKRGYEYYAVTDHAEKLHMTGMKREDAIAQRTRIKALQKRFPKMAILHGCELNIDKGGAVDYDPEFLAGFDFLVASVHSFFGLPRDEMTRRVIRAMENPLVNVIGHPSARLIGKRAGVDADWEALFDAAVRTGTAMEINSFPDRLDLRDEHVRWAVERGVTLAVSTDSHAPKHLDNLRFGVATAQRGWLTRKQTLNAKTLKQLRAFVEAKRTAAS